MKKSLRKLLTAFLIATVSTSAAGASHSMKPEECFNTGCRCYTPEALEQISQALVQNELLSFELEQYKGLQTVAEAQAWYSDPTLVIGGVVLGISLGGILGYALGKK